jgi:hypothetical protein
MLQEEEEDGGRLETGALFGGKHTVVLMILGNNEPT